MVNAVNSEQIIQDGWRACRQQLLSFTLEKPFFFQLHIDDTQIKYSSKGWLTQHRHFSERYGKIFWRTTFWGTIDTKWNTGQQIHHTKAAIEKFIINWYGNCNIRSINIRTRTEHRLHFTSGRCPFLITRFSLDSTGQENEVESNLTPFLYKIGPPSNEWRSGNSKLFYLRTTGPPPFGMSQVKR